MSILPEVSVCVTAYQHESYISECLDNILKQKTTFPFEIVIGEDESEDNTRKICEEFAVKNPDKVRLFLRSREDVIYKNGRPTGQYNFLENLKASRGSLLVHIDGDDYWESDGVLQRQYEFLKNNSDYVMVGFNARKNLINQETDEIIKKYKETELDFSFEDLIQFNPFVTCVTMFRKIEFEKLYPILKTTLVGDWPVFTYLHTFGKSKFINDPVGFYRVHETSFTHNFRKHYQLHKNDLIHRLEHAQFWNHYTGHQHDLIENKVLREKSRKLTSLAFKNNDYNTAIKYSRFVNIRDLNNISSKVIICFLKLVNRVLK